MYRTTNKRCKGKKPDVIDVQIPIDNNRSKKHFCAILYKVHATCWHVLKHCSALCLVKCANWLR